MLNRFGTWEARVKADAAAEVLKNAACTTSRARPAIRERAVAAAKMAVPHDLAKPRADAARRILGAMIAHPELMSGTGRVCATLIRAGGGRVAVKTGAEGFFGGWIPDLGLGIAIKIDDGAGRAAETAIAAVLDRLGLLGNGARGILRAPVLNTRGTVVGERRPAAALDGITIS